MLEPQGPSLSYCKAGCNLQEEGVGEGKGGSALFSLTEEIEKCTE